MYFYFFQTYFIYSKIIYKILVLIFYFVLNNFLESFINFFFGIFLLRKRNLRFLRGIQVFEV